MPPGRHLDLAGTAAVEHARPRRRPSVVTSTQRVGLVAAVGHGHGHRRRRSPCSSVTPPAGGSTPGVAHRELVRASALVRVDLGPLLRRSARRCSPRSRTGRGPAGRRPAAPCGGGGGAGGSRGLSRGEQGEVGGEVRGADSPGVEDRQPVVGVEGEDHVGVRRHRIQAVRSACGGPCPAACSCASGRPGSVGTGPPLAAGADADGHLRGVDLGLGAGAARRTSVENWSSQRRSTGPCRGRGRWSRTRPGSAPAAPAGTARSAAGDVGHRGRALVGAVGVAEVEQRRPAGGLGSAKS